jgi:hypothetical protein
MGIFRPAGEKHGNALCISSFFSAAGEKAHRNGARRESEWALRKLLIPYGFGVGRAAGELKIDDI